MVKRSIYSYYSNKDELYGFPGAKAEGELYDYCTVGTVRTVGGRHCSHREFIRSSSHVEEPKKEIGGGSLGSLSSPPTVAS